MAPLRVSSGDRGGSGSRVAIDKQAEGPDLARPMAGRAVLEQNGGDVPVEGHGRLRRRVTGDRDDEQQRRTWRVGLSRHEGPGRAADPAAGYFTSTLIVVRLVSSESLALSSSWYVPAR